MKGFKYKEEFFIQAFTCLKMSIGSPEKEDIFFDQQKILEERHGMTGVWFLLMMLMVKTKLIHPKY